MHSVKALFETWQVLLSYKLLLPTKEDCLEEISDIIQRVDDCDSFSTFFRYPFDKKGNKNIKEFVEDIDDNLLCAIPCSIGAILHNEGPENFKVWHGNNEMA